MNPFIHGKSHGRPWLALWLATFLLVGCSQGVEVEQARINLDQSAAQLDELRADLSGNRLPNAQVLSAYLDVMERERPELKAMLAAFRAETTPGSPKIASLQQRLADARAGLESGEIGDAELEEAALLAEATLPANYDDGLLDPINVLADLSNGKLSRISAPSREQSLTQNQAEDFGPGSQLIGNPQYGEWRQDGSGSWIWHWVGAYALFSALNNNRQYSYDRWSRHRDWSHYGDVGRRYGRPQRGAGPGTQMAGSGGGGREQAREASAGRRASSYGAPRQNSRYASRPGTRSQTRNGERASGGGGAFSQSGDRPAREASNRQARRGSGYGRSGGGGFASGYRSRGGWGGGGRFRGK